MGSSRADLLRRLAEAEERLAALERDRKRVIGEIEAIRREIEELPAEALVSDARPRIVASVSRTPSGRTRGATIPLRLPHHARGTISQRLFVQKGELPPAFLNTIKRIAAFQNPAFYKKQRMRLSTALTPRVISCAEDVGDYVSLPRGCWPEVDHLLREYGGTNPDRPDGTERSSRVAR
jgi:hypothetical protein